MKFALTLALALALTGCVTEAPAPVAAPVAATATEEPTPEPKPKPTPARTTPPPVEASGSYASVDDYINEVVDTTEKVASILGTVSDVAYEIANGTMPPEGGALIANKAAESVQSHITFFEQGTPPPMFADVEELLLLSLRAYREAFVEFEECSWTMDLDACDRSMSLMNDGTAWSQEAASLVTSITP